MLKSKRAIRHPERLSILVRIQEFPLTTATPTAPASALDAYQLVDADEVRAFLAAHPFVEPLLGEAAAQLPKYFPGAPLRLEVAYDGARPQLILEAIVPGWSVDAVEAALDDLDEKWWSSQFHRAKNLLVITTAFG